MNKILNITFGSIFLIIAFGCNNNSIVPPEDIPGRRDYVWTMDTINSFNPLRKLWGSSPTDVWAITVLRDYDNIYHFDSNQWTTGKYYLLYSPYSIYGFAQNNFYMGGSNGRIYRFDGNSFTQIAALTKGGNNEIVFDNIWGESPNDLYASGAYPDENGYYNNSVIAHFINGRWEMLNTKGLYGIVERVYKNIFDDKIYIQVIGGHEYTDSTFIYEYTNGKYIKLYGNIWVQGLQADLSLINKEVYFIIGSEIEIRINDQFLSVLKVDNPNFYQRIWGRNSKDIFLMMTDGLAHYNGSDIEYLFHYNLRTQIYGAALFEKDVFFLVYESLTGLSLIYHGKLKD